MSANVPSGLKYTKDHEWAKVDGADVVVGITAFAVEQLGDITLVNFDVKAGDAIEAGKGFGTIESVKTLSDLFAPLSGKVAKLNQELENKPELVNEDCYGKGWMVVISADASAVKLDDLMDERAYTEFLKASAH
jgi:glycine cleavage system H protein